MKKNYYIVLGYLVPTIKGNATTHGWDIKDTSMQDLIDEYKRMKYPLPFNKILLRLDNDDKIEVVYYEFNKGYLLLNVKTRGRAYHYAKLIRAFFTIFYGWSASMIDNGYYLLEINKKPKYYWSKYDLIKELLKNGCIRYDLEFEELGYILNKKALNDLTKFILLTYKEEAICVSLAHLLESYSVFNTFMTGSHYVFHYSRDRSNLDQMHLEKKYYERKFRYEIAFVAAFKAIESFFGVSDIKKHEIKKLFGNVDNADINFDKPYRRLFELYTDLKIIDTQGEMIDHFLKLRNVVGAHGNRNAPEHFYITEDSICEIQNFVSELISYKVYENVKVADTDTTNI